MTALREWKQQVEARTLIEARVRIARILQAFYQGNDDRLIIDLTRPTEPHWLAFDTGETRQ